MQNKPCLATFPAASLADGNRLPAAKALWLRLHELVLGLYLGQVLCQMLRNLHVHHLEEQWATSRDNVANLTPVDLEGGTERGRGGEGGWAGPR